MINQRGDILLRGDTVQGDCYCDNIFDLLTGNRGEQSDADRFTQLLSSRGPGTLNYVGQRGTYIFAYVPMEAVNDWFYISDRTQKRKTQNNLTEALQMAKAANQAKSAFLGSVSHDIRTPMNAIVGFITLLKDEADNPDVVVEYAGRIETASTCSALSTTCWTSTRSRAAAPH